MSNGRSINLSELQALREQGVKSATIAPDGTITQVEFFEQPLGFLRLDADTLVPPPPEGEQPEPRVAKVPPALSRLLKNGSVS